MSDRLDLRLVPAAGSAWLASAWAIGATSARVALVLTVLVILGGCAAVVAAWRWSSEAVAGGLGTVLFSVAVVGAVLSSSGAHLVDRENGPLAGAVQERAVVTITGIVASAPRPDPSPWSAGSGRISMTVRVDVVTVRAQTVSARGLVLVVGDGWPELVPDQSVEITGRLAPLTGSRVAVLTATEVIPGEPKWFAASMAGLRHGLHEAVAGLPADPRGLVPGSAVGDTSAIPEDLDEAMRTAGLSHLVAVSGQHMAVVLLAASLLAGALRMPRWLRVVFAVAVGVGFVTLVQGGPAVLRAAAMGAVAVAAFGLGRPARALPALSTAVILLLVVDPWASNSLGFQLSVVATAAIVLLARPAAVALHAVLPEPWSRRLTVARLTVLTVPLAAQSVVGPVLVLVDPVVTPWAVLANVLAAPAVVPATLLGLAATLVSWWPTAAEPIAWVAAWPAQWIAQVARGTAELPGAATPWTAGLKGATALGCFTAAGWFAARALIAERR